MQNVRLYAFLWGFVYMQCPNDGDKCDCEYRDGCRRRDQGSLRLEKEYSVFDIILMIVIFIIFAPFILGIFKIT